MFKKVQIILLGAFWLYAVLLYFGFIEQVIYILHGLDPALRNSSSFESHIAFRETFHSRLVSGVFALALIVVNLAMAIAGIAVKRLSSRLFSLTIVGICLFVLSLILIAFSLPTRA